MLGLKECVTAFLYFHSTADFVSYYFHLSEVMARTQGRAGTWRQAWLIVSTVLSLNRKFTYSYESTAGAILGILVLTAVFKGS